MKKNNKKIYPASGDWNELVVDELKNKEFAESYLKFLIEDFEKDGNQELFLACLSQVALAQGGITKLAKKAKLNRQNLYKALSKEGNPTFLTLSKVLNTLGFKLSIEKK
jgi:probable addiction module antidote protein